MLDFDDSRLRAQVIRDYVVLAREITDAAEMNRFAEAVISTAAEVVREHLRAFNRDNLAAGLPAKVLATCFRHLPFRFCIHPSHVCQSWRAAALSEPSLWSYILPWAPCKSPELLHMALSRVDSLPVDLEVDVCPPTDPEAVYTVIAPFSRQIRYISWVSEPPVSSWEFHAPIMEGICYTPTLTITGNFLGGHAGKLRCLYLQCVYLPPMCPVLSTVTELSVLSTPHELDAPPSTLGNVFELFPGLEWLQILGITNASSDMLPTGPAPTSLRELVLYSMSWKYDLMPHYFAWGAGNLRHVSLTQFPGTLPNIAPLASGTVRLAVKSCDALFNTQFMFEHSDAVSHSVYLRQLRISVSAALLADVQTCLANVNTVLISHIALEPFWRLLAGLPAVERLVLHIMPKTQMAAIYPEHQPGPFDWNPLLCLPDLARTVPTLRYITLQVWCGSSRRSSLTNADNARDLIVQLRDLGTTLPPIEIQGFPAQEVSSIDLTGLDVRFDVSTEVGELILRAEHEIYYPFDAKW